MPIRSSRRRVGAARLRTVLESLLDASPLCAIATVAGAQAYVNTAYFAWSDDFRIVWLSEPRATHSRNLGRNRTAAVAIFDSHQVWGRPDRGLQLFGTARQLRGTAAERGRDVYARRFRESRERELSAYSCYEFRPRRAKLFDERNLGAGVFVSARIAGDGTVTWERTEVYSAAS